jgi:predicted Ser/Thr protein kinase
VSSLIGRKLGQYEIIDELGQGGMAKVYLGRQESIGREVAIKILPPHPGLNEAFKQRFQLEAQTIGSLQNPNILPLYDYGTDGDVLYLVMAYAEGGTLGELIAQGAMEVDEVEKIVRSVASGLDYAHRKGIIHRDIKPGNILIHDGHPLLADFGMVKMVAGSSNLTGTAIVGTPAYMAPEQGQGLAVDHRVDIYALGVMTFEMLTGQPLYAGDTPMQMIMQHIREAIPNIYDFRLDLPEEISEVMDKVLAKEPDERYQSSKAFAEAFSAALHRDSETLADIQRQFPIENEAVTLTPAATLKAGEHAQKQASTIVIREGVSPLLMMGGFGLIALLIIILALMLMNMQNNVGVAPPNTEVIITPSSEPTEIAVVVLEPTATLVPTAIPEPTFGEVRFSSENALGDRLEVRLRDVMPLAGDTFYVAWLLNTASGDTLTLGRVPVDSFGEGTLPYTDSDGRLLPAHFNALLITEEIEIADVPVGEVVYSALLPVEVSQGLKEIFVESENGLNGDSLLAGAQTEAQTAVQHAGLAANASNIGGVRGHAEHTINILRGGNEDYDNSGSGSNPGRGIGVYFFIDAIDTILLDVTNQPEASLDLQLNAEFIRVCTQNVRLWADEIVALELIMIQGEALEAIAEETARSTELAAFVLDGFDLNQNSIVEPFEAECGLNQIPEYGLQFGRMEITQGDARE